MSEWAQPASGVTQDKACWVATAAQPIPTSPDPAPHSHWDKCCLQQGALASIVLGVSDSVLSAI